MADNQRAGRERGTAVGLGRWQPPATSMPTVSPTSSPAHRSPTSGANRDQGRLYVFRRACQQVVLLATFTATAAARRAPPAKNAKKYPAKLSLARATIVQLGGQVLDVLAPITTRASGTVRVAVARRRAPVAASTTTSTRPTGRSAFRKRSPSRRHDLGTGIITLAYMRATRTRGRRSFGCAPAAPAELGLGCSDRRSSTAELRASGAVTSTARGVVRLQLEYDHQGARGCWPSARASPTAAGR